jgi:hypothetical protein
MLILLLAIVVLMLLWRPTPVTDPFRIIATILIVLAIVGTFVGFSNPSYCTAHSFLCR